MCFPTYLMSFHLIDGWNAHRATNVYTKEIGKHWLTGKSIFIRYKIGFTFALFISVSFDVTRAENQ